MSRPEARRRPQQFAANQIAAAMNDMDDDSQLNGPPVTAPEQHVAKAARSLIDFVTWPSVIAGVALAVFTGVVWGALSRRRS